MAEKCQCLGSEELYILLTLLNKFEDLFDGMLGTRNTTMVDLKLRDDVKPVCSQPYTVPRVHAAMFKKKVEGLVRLGLLEEENDYEWGAPSFAQPKEKINIVEFLSDFRKLNRQLKHKLYPDPKIYGILLK